VKKSRDLYIVKESDFIEGSDQSSSPLSSRVHIDTVEGLGKFLELEVTLDEEGQQERGVRFANKLMEVLQVKESELISGAYMDMLAEKA